MHDSCNPPVPMSLTLNVSELPWCNPYTFTSIDGWVRRRLRTILRKRQHRRGLARGVDHQRWPNAFFEQMGLFTMCEAHRMLIQSR